MCIRDRVYLERTEGVSSSEIRSEERKVRLGIIGDSHIAKKYIREAQYVNGPVSYTHLDVYKRQIQKCADRFVDCSPFEVLAYFRNAEEVITDTFHGSLFSVITHRPVSYTHLDVYKRQHQDGARYGDTVWNVRKYRPDLLQR